MELGPVWRSLGLLVASLLGLHAQNSQAVWQVQPAQAIPPGQQTAPLFLFTSPRLKRALQSRDLVRAKVELWQAIEKDPSSAEAHLTLGLVEFLGGETKQAMENYRRGLKLDPNSANGHYNLGLALLREGNLQAGELELQRAVALQPQQADATYNLGVVLLELHRPLEAVTQLRRARTLSPDRPDAAFNLVRAELAATHTAEARSEARLAARDFGAIATWDASVGQLFLDQGQPRDAVIYLAEAVRLAPGQMEVRRRLAAAYLDLEEPELVLTTIPTAANAEDHYLRSRAYTLSHQFERADEEAKLALDQDPDNPRFLLERALILQHFGQPPSYCTASHGSTRSSCHEFRGRRCVTALSCQPFVHSSQVQACAGASTLLSVPEQSRGHRSGGNPCFTFALARPIFEAGGTGCILG